VHAALVLWKQFYRLKKVTVVLRQQLINFTLLLLLVMIGKKHQAFLFVFITSDDIAPSFVVYYFRQTPVLNFLKIIFKKSLTESRPRINTIFKRFEVQNIIWL
jgi:hypothetical protein